MIKNHQEISLRQHYDQIIIKKSILKILMIFLMIYEKNRWPAHGIYKLKWINLREEIQMKTSYSLGV